MKRKWLLLTITAAAVITTGLLVYTFLPDRSTQAAEVPVNTATVTKGNIVVSVAGAGSVSATETSTIKTKDAGKVAEVLVEEGDLVKKGQTLITFEGDDLSDSLKQEETSLNTLQLDLQDKQEQYKKLAQAGSSDEDLTSAKRSIEKAKTDIESQIEKIASVEEDMIPPDPLTAPIDGTVTIVNISSGEEAMNGSELINITDYANLSVVVQVDELDIPAVEAGMPAIISVDALPETEFQGVVTEIAKEGTTSNGVSLFDVTVGLTKSDGVRVGMSAEVSITTNEKNDILIVPIEAVQERNGRYTVSLPVPAGEEQAPMPSDAPDTGERAMPSGAPNTGDREMPSGAPDAGDRPMGGRAMGTDSGAASTKDRNTVQDTLGNGSQQTITVEVGIHDESSIEIISGLNEGDKVIIPTIISSGSAATTQQQIQGGLGSFGGGTGGFGGTGGGMGVPSGGVSGGGGGGR